MANIPQSHREDSVKLNPQQLISLFKITLTSGLEIYLHSGREIDWNNNTFEEAYIEVSGVARNSGDTRVRPTLTLGNPNAVFHVPVSEGALDQATVIRYKVKPDNLLSDPPIYESNTWYVAQVTGLGDVITCELRSNSDRQETVIPARQFLKPEFPSVTL